MRDIEQLREVARLTAEGLGLEGVRRVLDLENQVRVLRGQLTQLQAELDAAHAALAATPNLPVPAAPSQLVVWRRR